MLYLQGLFTLFPTVHLCYLFTILPDYHTALTACINDTKHMTAAADAACVEILMHVCENISVSVYVLVRTYGGVCVLSGDDMKWFGEIPVRFTNWDDSSSPSDLVPIDTCVALHSSTGKWENVSCLDNVENGVICETDQSKI